MAAGGLGDFMPFGGGALMRGGGGERRKRGGWERGGATRGRKARVEAHRGRKGGARRRWDCSAGRKGGIGGKGEGFEGVRKLRSIDQGKKEKEKWWQTYTLRTCNEGFSLTRKFIEHSTSMRGHRLAYLETKERVESESAWKLVTASLDDANRGSKQNRDETEFNLILCKSVFVSRS